jgi:hypothetical protein
MGPCLHCGKDAGWFKDRHSECEAHELMTRAVINLTLGYVRQAVPRHDDVSKMREITKTANLDPDQLRTIIIQAWEQSLEASRGWRALD